METKKILIKEPMVIVVGDYVLESNRFNSRDYTLYRINAIKDDGYMSMEVMKVGGTCGFRIGAVVGGEYRCLFGQKNVKWLTYYMPTAKVLYG